MTSPTDNKQIVRGAYDAMASGDVGAFMGALDADVEVREPPSLPHGGTYRGLGGLEELFSKAMPILEPGKLDVIQLTADEDRVIALLRLGLKGGSDALVSEHWRLRNGKVVEVRAFWEDPLAATGQATG